MNRDEVAHELFKVIKAIKRNDMETSEWSEDAFLGGDLGLDSVEVLEAIVDIQKVFQVEIPKEDLGELYTVKDVVDLVLRHKVLA